MHRSGQMGVGFLRFSTSTESKSMKKIEAIIKPFKLEEVRSALASLGVNDITVSEVECCGRRHGLSQHHHDREYASDFHPKIKMEVMVADDLTGAVSAAIVEAAKTGTSGDGSVFVFQVEQAVRIRAQEKDQLAEC
jgi:nitrogen regulatory protein P-II 1